MKTKFFLASMVMLAGLSSCQKLERELSTDFTEDQVITSYNRTSFLLNSVYGDLREGYSDVSGAMMASATDEAEHARELDPVQRVNIGDWSATSNPDDVWSHYYKAIRKANYFLELDKRRVNLDLYKTDLSLFRQRSSELVRWNYEARFLRAFFYFELVKRYGGVPLITQTLGTDATSGMTRSSLATCVKFITDECDSVINAKIPGVNTNDNPGVQSIPLQYVDIEARDIGRVGTGMALALKSRVLLYAASNLFNSPSAWAGSYAKPEFISFTDVSPAARQQRWLAAANAAEAVINAYGGNPTLGNYDQLFGTGNHKVLENIFVRRNAASSGFEQNNWPVGFANGSGKTNPSQNLVDAYEVKVNSTTSVMFNWADPVHKAAPYANRDPRLALSIAVNQSNLSTENNYNRKLEMYIGGQDASPKPNATKTGYYIRKYINSTPASSSIHNWVFIRMAEIFLNYAEAKNELGDFATARTYINKVRTRPGVDMPQLNVAENDTRDKILQSIIRERQVEFAFEDHRAWDARRWMLGPDILGSTIRGVNITRTGSLDTYAPFNLESRNFVATKMYLYPIPQSEILKSSGLVQNPGW